MTTRWTLILQSQGDNPQAAKLALSELFEIYWFPLYAFARHRGLKPEDAQDQTQGFFRQLLENDTLLLDADPQRGRFRALVKTAFQRFLTKDHRKQQSQKRGSHLKTLVLDYEDGESRYQLDPYHEETAEKIFERRWALALLDRVLNRLQARYEEDGKGNLFDSFKHFLTGSKSPNTQRDIGDKLGLTPTASKVAVHRLRQRYGHLLRQEVLHTIDDPKDLEEELGALVKALEK
jgi:DNA-directed RNA polymerase specialized sigma24 family protein